MTHFIVGPLKQPYTLTFVFQSFMTTATFKKLTKAELFPPREVIGPFDIGPSDSSGYSFVFVRHKPNFRVMPAACARQHSCEKVLLEDKGSKEVAY